MPDGPGGNVLAEAAKEEHDHLAGAKKVLLKGFDGSTYPTLSTEPYEGGAKDALAVSFGPALSMTSEYFQATTSTDAASAADTTRQKILFVADKGNSGSVYLLTASTASFQLGIELEAGDAFGDSTPYPYQGGWWVKASVGTQNVTVQQWFS
jgi:hypothetical protein